MAVVQWEIPERLTDGVVSLRLLAPGDAAAYARAFADDPDLGRLLGFDTDPTTAELGASLAGVAARARDGQAIELAIVDAGDDRFLGSVLLFGFSERHRRCEVGFWVVPGARRAGVARRAVTLAVDWCLAGPGLERIDMTTTPENPVIPAFAQRMGFTYEGCLRRRNRERGARVDILWFGLLADEWPRPDPS
jgi:ribosomal-protein-alanine N-acetyltransferase